MGLCDKLVCAHPATRPKPHQWQLQVLPGGAHLTATSLKVGVAEQPKLGTARSVAPTMQSPPCAQRRCPVMTPPGSASKQWQLSVTASSCRAHVPILPQAHCLPLHGRRLHCSRKELWCCFSTSCDKRGWTNAACKTTLTKISRLPQHDSWHTLLACSACACSCGSLGLAASGTSGHHTAEAEGCSQAVSPAGAPWNLSALAADPGR